MAKKELKPIEELTFEAAYAELESIVAALESGEKPLDESMQLYERGQALTKHCTALLDKAELKVQELTDSGLAEFEEEQ